LKSNLFFVLLNQARHCHWCAREYGAGVCRPMGELCPASFGMDIGQEPQNCPTAAPTPAVSLFLPQKMFKLNVQFYLIF